MPSKDSKKRQANKLACQKWRMQNPDKAADSTKNWARKNPGKVALHKKDYDERNVQARARLKKRYEERNVQARACQKKRYDERNVQQRACQKKRYDEQNLQQRACQKKRYDEQNVQQRACQKKRYDERNVQARACRGKRYDKDHQDKLACRRKRYKNKNPEVVSLARRHYDEKNRDKLACRRKRYKNKNPEVVSLARRHYDEKNRDKLACRRKRYKNKNPEVVSLARRHYDEKNRDKLACRRKRYKNKNPEVVALARRHYDEKNRDKLACRRKRYKNKNPHAVAREKRRWRNRHLQCMPTYLKEWRQKNSDKVERYRMMRLKNVTKNRCTWRKWYSKNAPLKRLYRMCMYKERLEQERRMRKQRYQIDLAIDAQYYRGRTFALIRSGEKTAEWKFVKAVAKDIRTKQKRRHSGEVTYEARLLVAKALHARSKLIRDLKRYYWRLKRQCDTFIANAKQAAATDDSNADADDDEEEWKIEQICGVGQHCEAREPHFYDFAYRDPPKPPTTQSEVLKIITKSMLNLKRNYSRLEGRTAQNCPKASVAPCPISVPIPLPEFEIVRPRRSKKRKGKKHYDDAAKKSDNDGVLDAADTQAVDDEGSNDEGQNVPRETWTCDPNKCLHPDEESAYADRLIKICENLADIRRFRRCIAKADNCPHMKHVYKDVTLGPEEVANNVQDYNDYEYGITVKEKLGNSLACLADTCRAKNDLLFLRQLSVHYPSVFKLLALLYTARVCDQSLHKLDRALIKGDHQVLQGFVNDQMRNIESIEPNFQNECPEERIKTVRYAMDFLKKIQEKRCFPCASCCTLHYRNTVTQIQLKENDVTGELEVYAGKYVKRKGARKDCNPLWKELFAFAKEKGRKLDTLFICDGCLRALYSGNKHASQSVFNNLRVAAVPKELSDLNEFEKQFIQKAKCFQVIVRLGTVQSKLPASDRVKAQKGQVVHYPLPISETLRTLPDPESMPDNANLYIIVFGVPTKSRVVWKELVDVKKVQAALECLKSVNPEYTNINVDRDPLETAELVDEQGDDDAAVLDACQQVAKRSMVRKIDEKEEAFIVDSYTVRSLFNKMPQQNDLELYAMERVAAERIDSREAKLDLWCFPHLYPDGRNAEGEPRDALPNQAFIRNRLFNEDARFRLEQQYIFYLLHKYQLRQVANAVLQQLRSTYQYKDVSVRDFVQQVSAGEQGLEGNLHTMFSNIRGTQQYWTSIRRDVRTMVRELGPPTWFVTLSAAEYDWSDMREHLISANKDVPGIEEMRNGERCAMDPVFTSEHFHHRFMAFFNTVLRAQGGGPLGEIVDYFYRVEYQSRGAPHYHMLLWVKDAPRIGVNTSKEVLEFIQKHVTCRLPDKDKEPLLYDYVTRFLKHTCNDYCLKLFTAANGRKFRACRFGFPRSPTGVAILHDPLETCAQRASGKKTKQRLYELVRSRDEERINDYNAEVLLLWAANIDVQYVGEDTLAVVNYVTDYVTKSERSDLDKLWSEVSKDQALSKQLFNFGCKALSARECGAYEAVDMITGRSLYSMSRSVVYINARKPHQRPRQLKTLSKLKEIEKNDPHSTEKFENNWITTYYPDRPDALEDMCLYDCRRLHDVMGAACEQKGAVVDRMQFRNPAYGSLKLRTKPYLVSHPYFKYAENKEDYCYSLLLMFKPFRNESEELIDPAAGSCIPVFEQELACNEMMKAHHDKLQMRQNKLDENIKAIAEITALAAAEEQRDAGAAADVAVMGEPVEACDAMQELNAIMRLPGEENLEDNVERMNADQRRIYERISGHLSGNSDDQLLMFISGAGGTGKSFLVNTLKMWAKQHYAAEGSGGTTIAVAAPTGLAAYNVNGVTLHRLLQLPVQHNLNAKYTALSDDVCKELRQTMKHLRLLVIDEISMVSNVMLAYAHLRLNQIVNSSEDRLFGDLNVIVMGDLAQLAPVGDKPAFRGLSPSEARNKIGSVGGTDLWKQFTYDELTESMRQKDDALFADLLNRLRFGQMTDDDVNVLKTRLISVPEGASPMEVFTERFANLRTEGQEIVCLMAKSAMVAEFNERMLQKENREIIELPAEDSFQWNGRPASTKVVASAKKMLAKKGENVTDTAGMEATLRVCLGARVMLRRNINVEAGLVNGAIGSVVEVKQITGKVVSLRVKFDNIDEIQDIERKVVKFALTNQIYVSRAQFPLILSYAITIHKSQGLSLSRAMVDVGNSIFQEGMTYVALSRVRTLDGLHLINFDPSKANANKLCVGEINRLRQTLPQPIPPIEVPRRKLKWEPDRIWCGCMQDAMRKANKANEQKKDEAAKQGTRKRRATAIASKSTNGPAVKKSRTKASSVSKGDSSAKLPNRRKRNLNPVGDEPPVAKKPRGSRVDPTPIHPRGSRQTSRVAAEHSTSDVRLPPATAAVAVNFGQETPPGLENNCGVVCYSNSAMHALMALQNFAGFCERLDGLQDDVAVQLLAFKRSYETQGGVISTKALRLALTKRGCKFDDGDGEQCALEFTQQLLENVGFADQFMVTWRDQYMCDDGPGGVRDVWFGPRERGIALILSPRRYHRLSDLIYRIKPQPDMRCPKCGNIGGVGAITKLETLPEQLIIYLLRYGGTDDDHAPIEYELDRVNIAGQNYRIVAAIEHFGIREGGHYIAYVRRGDAWWQCNDSRVTPVEGPPPGLETGSVGCQQGDD